MATPRRSAMRMGVGPAGGMGRQPEDDAAAIPYDDFSILQKEAIEYALGEAWRRLPAEAARQAIDLKTAAEPVITRLLRDEMEKLRRDETRPIPDFTEDAFGWIPEGEGAPNSSGRPEKDTTKLPDLVVRPAKIPGYVVRTSMYGLFIECKIIHRSTDHHGVGDYCDKGLIRFVDGTYAAVMRSGMMVAYVRNRETVVSCLTPHLLQNHELYEVKSLPSARKRESFKPIAYVSRHGRSTVAVGSRGRSPGDIEIVHIWLDVP